MSLGVITSRRYSPWPKIHWVIRRDKSDDGRVTQSEDYELIWPWMRCIGIGIHKGG
jgi:hypothetical protein